MGQAYKVIFDLDTFLKKVGIVSPIEEQVAKRIYKFMVEHGFTKPEKPKSNLTIIKSPGIVRP